MAAVNALKTATKEPSVKRFVYTSSSMAAYTPKNNEPMNITTDTWNYETVREAWTPPHDNTSKAYAVYGASKTQAEQELWRWWHGHRSERPDFAVNSVLPNENIGVILEVKHQGLPSTAGLNKPIWDGEMERFTKFLPPQYYVDI